MNRKTISSIAIAFMLIFLCGTVVAQRNSKNCTYSNPIIDNSLPDPTIIRTDDGMFYLYATEDIRNVPIYKSPNLVDWTYVGTAFNDSTRPRIVKRGGIWAPDINYINGRYVLYYAMSRWGGEWDAGIGVATADSPEGPFTDHGKIMISREIGIQNCIDEFYIEDNGHKYLFWGSFRGIYGAELTDDGLRLKPGVKPQRVAGTFMEAAYIHRRGGYYYLFGSNGTCCEGLKSTYKVTVGRSKSLFGPYVDHEGKQLLDNHFETVLHRGNGFVGTGHNAEIVTDDRGKDWIIYHSFKADDPDAGRVVCMDELKWKGGWPYVDGKVPAKTHKCPVFKKLK